MAAGHAPAPLSRRFEIMEGPLSKWTNVVNGWQYRWFVLDQNAGLLSYYTSKDKMKRGSRRGCFQLKRAIIGIDDEDDSTFTIRVDNRTYHFQGQNSDERERWVQALDNCIRRLHQPVRVQLELTLPENRRALTLDQRMAEAESYYQLLHEQIQAVSQSLNVSEEAVQIRQTAKTMLEALRQCIDIMKDAQLAEGSDLSRSPSHEPTTPPSTVSVTLPEVEEVKRGGSSTEEVEGGTQDSEDSSRSDDASSDVSSQSSDEYFDADAELENFPQSPTLLMSPSVTVPPAEGDPSDVEDDFEFTEEDDTSDGVAQNKSVIMHMLSQVRVGMDLTRIVLPTFILEKRSLLDMYAEFMAHPDLFAAIPDLGSAKERMVAIVRYYVSAFHAARKGTIAKKPYNPILGETFLCYWNLPGGRRTSPDEDAKKILESGPVPFAGYDSVTFVAEQVSHHPPVSGLYVECPSKRMYASGYIWTKSRFLGLSLGVHNIGAIHLHLLDHGEEYVMNLPNAYGRSILTVPWLELGGKCYLSCAQTGYNATVEFHCKPFYGGRKHRVTAEVFHVSDRKPFLRVEGEWNGVMYKKYPNGDQEVFMDTLNTPTIRKKLKKLSAQDPGESRRRWQHVTKALARKDVEEATDFKHALEEKQRADAKERQRLGTEWQQKYFHAEGDAWVYNTPLDSRLENLGQQ